MAFLSCDGCKGHHHQMRHVGSHDRISLRIPFPVRIFFILTACLWIASILSCVLSGWRTGAWDDAFRPISFPFPFMDFFCYVRRFRHLHQSAFFLPARLDLAWEYPAPCALLYDVLYRMLPASVHPETMNYAFDTFFLNPLSLTVLPLVLLSVWSFARSLVTRGLDWKRAVLTSGGLAALSWPLYFALQRGNLDALLWFPLLGGVWALTKRRFIFGACLIGLASAFKLYPVVLLALLLPARHYRALLCGVAAFLVMSFGAIVWLGPTPSIAFHATQSGIAQFTSQYALHYDSQSIGYDHSLFSCIKSLIPSAKYGTLLKADRAYLIIAGVLVTVTFFITVSRRPWQNQLLLVTTTALMLPSTSFDYSLLGLYTPFVFLVLSSFSLQHRRSKSQSRWFLITLVLFAFLLAPETFLALDGRVYAGQFKALCLVALGSIAAIVPWADDHDMPIVMAS